MSRSHVIAVFSSSRADVGPLKPVVEALDADPDADLLLMLAGTHGSTVLGGGPDVFSVGPGSTVVRLADDLDDSTPGALVRGGQRIAEGLLGVLEEHRPDVVVVLGDRWELLFAVPPAVLLGVPIAHLHGGEVTGGAIDERVRHAVSKLSDLHLCATEEAAARLRQLGEDPATVLVTGAPSLDTLRQTQPAGDDELGDLLGEPVRRPFGLVTYHACAGVDDPQASARAVFQAVGEVLGSAIITYPGLDEGYEGVLLEAESAAAQFPHVVLKRSLGPSYPRVMASADVIVGNSSSGIIEAATFGVPVVDVGPRQAGRTPPANVWHVDEDHVAVATGLNHVLSDSWRSETQGQNPYGDGHAVPRIMAALSRLAEGAPKNKQFVDL